MVKPGVGNIQSDLPPEVIDERVMAAVQAHFRPEFLNRIDEVIVLIQRELADPLALRLLSGEFTEGDTVKVAVEDGELEIN